MCSGTLRKHKVQFAESRYFAQNTECFYISGNRQSTPISKNNFSKLEIIHNAVANETNGVIFLFKENLCYLNGVGDVNKFLLSDYGREKFSQKITTIRLGFL